MKRTYCSTHISLGPHYVPYIPGKQSLMAQKHWFCLFLFHLGSSYCHWLVWEDSSPDRIGISQALLDQAANTLGVSHLVPSSLLLQKLFPHQLLSKFGQQIQDLRAVSRAIKAIFLLVFKLLSCVPWERYSQVTLARCISPSTRR